MSLGDTEFASIVWVSELFYSWHGNAEHFRHAVQRSHKWGDIGMATFSPVKMYWVVVLVDLVMAVISALIVSGMNGCHLNYLFAQTDCGHAKFNTL